MKEFITIKKFSDEQEFNQLLHILEKHGITYQTESYRQRIESVSMATLPQEYIVKISPNKFNEVHEILNNLAAQAVFDAEKTHYLFDFTDKELHDVLAKPDEWSAFDYQLALKILKDSGKHIDTDFLNSLRKTRIEDLSKPEGNQKINIVFGYLLALFGGLIAIGIGLNIVASKKILPNGEQIYSYSENDRKHGYCIIFLGTVMFIWLIYRFLFINIPNNS